jgi:hypothetical protein
VEEVLPPWEDLQGPVWVSQLVSYEERSSPSRQVECHLQQLVYQH